MTWEREAHRTREAICGPRNRRAPLLASPALQARADSEHVPALARVPGVLCARRFEGAASRSITFFRHPK